MKRKSILKAIGIAFLIYVVLTWIIPTGYFENGKYVADKIVPVGLFDLIRYPLITVSSSVFILMAMVVLLTGALYGVLNKTGVYQEFIGKIVNKYKNKGLTFVIISTILFTVLSSLTGLSLPLFVIVPFFATTITLLGYSKLTAMLSTIGGILVGNVVSTYGFNIAGYITYFSNNINDSILYRLILFALVLGLFVYAVIKSCKTKEKVKNEEIALYEKSSSKSKKSAVPMIIIMSLSFVITIVGMINWAELTKTTFFTDMYNNLTSLKIGSYPIGSNLIGSIYKYGSWTNYELCMMLIITILALKFAYKIKFADVVDGMKKGVKELLPIAFYILIANTIFLMMNASSTGYTIFPTIANKFIKLTEGFNGITYGFMTFIGSFLYNDFPYLLGSLYDPMTTLYSNSISVMGIIAQGIHGLVQIIAPTSFILIIGLTYFDIDYKDWIKKIFKFVLATLIILILLAILMILI